MNGLLSKYINKSVADEFKFYDKPHEWTYGKKNNRKKAE